MAETDLSKAINDALANIKVLKQRLEEAIDLPILLKYDKDMKEVNRHVDIQDFYFEIAGSDNYYILAKNLMSYYNRTQGQVIPKIEHALDLLTVQLTELQKLGQKKIKDDMKGDDVE